MAGKKLIISGRVNASSILEVVVSMVIILLVFGIAMTIFANVTRSSLSTKEMNARVILHKILLQAEQQNDYSTKTIAEGDLKITEEFKPRVESSNLIEIKLTAYDINEHQTAQLQKIIIKTYE